MEMSLNSLQDKEQNNLFLHYSSWVKYQKAESEGLSLKPMFMNQAGKLNLLHLASIEELILQRNTQEAENEDKNDRRLYR